MILVLVLIVLLIALSVVLAYTLGFRLGTDHSRDELIRVRSEAAHAARQMHDLTRQAFVAMTEEAARHRRER